MNDKNLGMFLVTAVMAPVMIVCCGGGFALVAAAAGGLTELLTGNALLVSVLIFFIGVAVYALARRGRVDAEGERDV